MIEVIGTTMIIIVVTTITTDTSPLLSPGHVIVFV
jgi:hypothetical protein